MSAASSNDLAPRAELTLFAPDASRHDLEQLCAEARRQAVHGVCVNGSRVALAYALLEDSGVHVVALVGFPLGAMDGDVKRYETEAAVDHGAHEIDFVLSLGALRDGDANRVLRELRDIVEAADERPVKVVLETHLLGNDEKILACRLALDSGAQFVSTSTDFNAPPVTVEEVALLRQTVGEKFGVKAAGGIEEAAAARALVEAGAGRIGILAGGPLARTLMDL